MKSRLMRLAGVAILACLLVWVVDLAELQRVLRGFNPWALAMVIPWHVTLWVIRARRWQILLRNEAVDIPFLDTLAVSASGFFLGCLTPGRLGEFAKVKFLMNAGHSFRAAFLSSLLERLLDIATLMAYVFYAAAVCGKGLPREILGTLAVTGLAGAGLIAVYGSRRWIKKAILKSIPESLAGSLEEKWSLLTGPLRRLTAYQWTELTAGSLALWSVNHVIIYLLFTGAGYTLPLYVSFAFSTWGSLAAIVPFSIYGVGVREAAMIGLFTLAGYPAGEAQTAGVVFGLMFVVLLVYHIVWGFAWWISPVMRRYLTKPA